MSEKEKNRENNVLSSQKDGKTCHDFSNFAEMETSDPNWHKLLTGGDFILPEEVVKELEALETADLYDFWNGSYGGSKRKTR